MYLLYGLMLQVEKYQSTRVGSMVPWFLSIARLILSLSWLKGVLWTVIVDNASAELMGHVLVSICTGSFKRSAVEFALLKKIGLLLAVHYDSVL